DLWKRLDRLLEYHAVECRPTRLEKADDLAQPQPQVIAKPTIRKRGGRGGGIEAAHRARESRKRRAQHGTKSKQQIRNNRNQSVLFCLVVRILNLFRISSFVFRILRPRGN